MVRKCLLAMSILSILILRSSAASDKKYGADFLQQLTVAEVDGMGESFVAYSVGAASLNNNPAGLSNANGSELLINAHKLPRIVAVIMKEEEDGKWEDYGKYSIEPTEMGLISYALPLGKFGNLGMGFVFHYGGRFIRVDKEGKAVGSFPRDDMAFTIGYSFRILQSVSLGLDIRSIRSKVPVEDGSSIGRTTSMNVGFLHQMGDRVRVGAVLQNIGGNLSFNEPDIPDSLRRRLLMGANYIVRDSENSVLSIGMDVNPPFDDGPRYNIGAELMYAKRLAFRVGYMRSTETYYEPLINLRDGSFVDESRVWVRKGLTIGVGLTLRGFDINFARAPRREPVLEEYEKSRLEKNNAIMSLSCTAKF
jgi:hypothetical protein